MGTVGFWEHYNGSYPRFCSSGGHPGLPPTNPHLLQLGTVGSRATMNYGADIRLEASGISNDTYVDITNFGHYDMIIGTPFMHRNKVVLDFKNKQVIVNGTPTPAVKVLLDNSDRRMHQYCSIDK